MSFLVHLISDPKVGIFTTVVKKNPPCVPPSPLSLLLLHMGTTSFFIGFGLFLFRNFPISCVSSFSVGLICERL